MAVEKQAELLIIDDKRARREARELGLNTVSTTALLRWAEQAHLIDSFMKIKLQLQKLRMFLPRY